MSIDDCKLIELPVIENPAGHLTFIEAERHAPFPIARVYYLYDVPEGAVRGGHAHRELDEMIMPIGGSFDVVIDDGREKKTVTLDQPRVGLHLPKLIWRELENFTAGSFCLVLASAYYEEDEYIRDYDEFLAAIS